MSKRLTENKPADTPVTAARPVKNTDTLPRRIASWLGLLLLIAFPGVTYFIEPRFGVAASACLLILATLLRILYKPNALTGIMAMVTAILGILVAPSQSLLMLKFWPVLAVILVIFALFIGLGKDDGMVAKAVAGPEGAKTDPQRVYARSLSYVWIVLFVLLGAVAALTCFWGNLKSWAFWNGGVAWFVILIFYGTERAARGFILRDLERQAEKNRATLQQMQQKK